MMTKFGGLTGLGPLLQVFQASIASLLVCMGEVGNNVLLDLRLTRFFKGVTQ